MYSAENIVWVKSIKRDAGSDWAYENLTCELNETEQKLHWRTDIGQTAGKHPKIGDIILLFQTLNHGKHRGVRLTHLVSPVSDPVLHDPENHPDYRYYREVKLIAKASPIHAIPKPNILHFGSVGNGGLTFGIDLLANDSINKKDVQTLIWDLFRDHFCINIADDVFSQELQSDNEGQSEGDTETRKHIELETRNRSARIVLEKKAEGLRNGNGRIFCECCGFDFVEAYGLIGERYIECHHKIFLSTGQRITRLEDLALVCSNCHRMLHRRKLDNTHYTVEELKHIVLRLENKKN